MAILTTQTITKSGVIITPVAMSVSDTFVNNGKTVLEIVNASGTTRTITVNSIAACDQGFDHDVSFTVANGVTKFVGPFDISRFNNSTGYATVTVDVAASVTIAVISL